MSKTTIEARLEKLAELTTEDLAELEKDIEAGYDQANDADDLPLMETLVSQLEQIHEFRENPPEVDDTVAEAAAEEETAPVVEAEAEVEAEPEVEATEASTDAAEAAEVEVPADTDTDTDTSTETETEVGAEVVEITAQADATDAGDQANNTQEENQAMAASADFEPPEDARPVVASAGLTVRAAADVADITAGSDFKDLAEVNAAMTAKIQSIKGSRGGDGTKMPVATVVASIPEDRQLTRGDVDINMARIDAIIEPEAITAAGGYCAPLQVKYDIFGLGSTARPVRDGLPSFGATRGGIRYVAPPRLGDYLDAVGLWTAENDANPAVDTDTDGAGPDTATGLVIPKNKMIVECAAELTADVDAVTLQLQFGNLMSRAYPELVQRHNALALVEHARFAERNLLSQIGAGSTAITSAFRVGTARDFLFSIAKAGAAYRNRHRVNRTTPLRVIAPEWVLDAMREDLAQQLPGDNVYALSDSMISQFLNARNINVTWHMDDAFSAQSAGAMVNFPATIVWYIFAEGTWLFLDGGTLDLGVVRDSGLVGTNDYITFVETFEGTAKVGVESIQVTTTTHVTGGSVGTIAVS